MANVIGAINGLRLANEATAAGPGNVEGFIILLVKRCRGRCDCTRVGGEYGLVAFAVFFFVRIVLAVLLALDIRRQWQVTKLV